MDTSISYSNLQTAYFSSDEAYWIRRIHKLAEQRPDLVKITTEPEDNLGVIQAEISPRIIDIRPPHKNIISEEESARRRRRMIKLTDLQREQGKKKVKFD